MLNFAATEDEALQGSMNKLALCGDVPEPMNEHT
jgi:hypothetical protein